MFVFISLELRIENLHFHRKADKCLRAFETNIQKVCHTIAGGVKISVEAFMK